MKSSLSELISQIDDIKRYFHLSSKGLPRSQIIYDVPAFSSWKQAIQFELQDIFDRTRDQYVWHVLTLIRQGFSGWKDETSFNELIGSLSAIEKNLEKYYPNEKKSINIKGDVSVMPQKGPKIFLSHSTLDKEYVKEFVELFENIGLNHNHIFCSSMPGYDIPLDQEIYDYLKRQFDNHQLYIIFFLSQNYYHSVACMNEMGAAWVLRNEYTSILLPGFEFKEIEGAINPRIIGIKLDNDPIDLKEKLGQLKNNLEHKFSLPAISNIRWEQKRDEFLAKLSVVDNNSNHASYIPEHKHPQIFVEQKDTIKKENQIISIKEKTSSMLVTNSEIDKTQDDKIEIDMDIFTNKYADMIEGCTRIKKTINSVGWKIITTIAKVTDYGFLRKYTTFHDIAYELGITIGNLEMELRRLVRLKYISINDDEVRLQDKSLIIYDLAAKISESLDPNISSESAFYKIMDFLIPL